MTLESKLKLAINATPLGSQRRNCLRQILGDYLTSKVQEQTFLSNSLRANNGLKHRVNEAEQERIRLENQILLELGAK